MGCAPSLCRRFLMLNASLIRPCAIIRSLFCAKLDLLERTTKAQTHFGLRTWIKCSKRPSRQKRSLLIFAYRAWIRLVCATSRCCLPPWVFCLDPFHVWLAWRFHRPLPCKCQMQLLGRGGPRRLIIQDYPNSI